jgi:hypothetical protein
MKLTSLLTISALSLFLIAAPIIGHAKEQQKKHSPNVVVNNSKSHGNSNHKSNNHKSSNHKSNKRHNYNNNHKSKNHKRHHSNNGHKRRHHGHNLAKAIITGSILHHAFGRHGSHYNGHAWCPSHNLYHTHRYGYSYGYSYNDNYSSHNYNTKYKVDSYIELDNDKCFKVTEFSNGDERRKRIRDHHCADIVLAEDDWDDFEEPQ